MKKLKLRGVIIAKVIQLGIWEQELETPFCLSAPLTLSHWFLAVFSNTPGTSCLRAFVLAVPSPTETLPLAVCVASPTSYNLCSNVTSSS